MGPKPHPKPLHLAVGVILAVAVAVAAESRAHSYGLALRTVRESLGMQSLWLGGALAFAVLFTVLASWRVGRGWLLLAPPALAAGSALAAGHLEAAQQAARATTALTMGQRAAVLALGLVRPAGFAGLGLLVASALLAWAALVVASRAHAPPLPGPRRALALLVGVLAIGGVAVALPSWHRAVGWIGASPAIVGVVAVYVASARLASGDPRERGMASMGVLGAVILTTGAVLAAAAARGLEAGVGLGDEGPNPVDWSSVVALLLGRFLMESGAAAWFIAPAILAGAVVMPWSDVRAAAPRMGAVVLGSTVPLLLAALAVAFLHGPATLLRELRPTLTPSGFSLPSVTRGGDCRAMQEDSVVHIGTDRIYRGAVDIGPATRLDDPASCAALAAEALPGREDIWTTADERTTFARTGCLLGALADARGALLLPGSQPRSRRWSTIHDPAELPSSPCTVWWVSRDATDGSPRCPSVALGGPYCRGGRPGLEPEKVEPEATFDIQMDRNAFRLRWLNGDAVIHQRVISRVLGRDDLGHPRFAELADAMANEWRSYGRHRDPTDGKLDLAVLRPSPETPIPEVVAAAEALRETRRDYSIAGTRVTVPVVDLSLALPAMR